MSLSSLDCKSSINIKLVIGAGLQDFCGSPV
jgi:hypothetical protein